LVKKIDQIETKEPDMSTLSTNVPFAAATLTAPFRMLAEAVAVLSAANRAAMLADHLFKQSDDTLAARGMTREDIAAKVLAELDRR
jgi:hypothetical protein